MSSGDVTEQAAGRDWVPGLGLLLVSFLWGTTFVAVKSALVQVDPLAFVAIRFGIAALLAVVLLRARPGVRTALWIGVPLGIVLGTAYAAQTLGLVETTPSRSAFITGAGVVTIPLWGIVVLRRRPGRFPFFGLALAVFGVWLITDPSGGNWNAGDSWTLLCSVLFALHVVLLTRFGSHEIFALLFSQLAVTSILAGLASAAMESPPRVLWSGSVLFVLALTGILVSFVATLLQLRLQPRVSPGRTAVIFATEPVFAALFSIVFMGERLGVRGWIGGGLVLLGILLSELGWHAFRSGPRVGRRTHTFPS